MLRNLLGITDPDELDDVELVLLEEVEADQQITVAEKRKWHRNWLSAVYEWQEAPFSKCPDRRVFICCCEFDSEVNILKAKF